MLGLFIVRYLISVSKHIPDLFSIVVHELKHVEGMLNPCESSHGFKKVAIVGMGGSEKNCSCLDGIPQLASSGFLISCNLDQLS